MSTSRYDGLAIVPVSEFNERPELAVRELLDVDALERAGRLREHVVTQGERIDYLAYQQLGDSRLWWVIADLNPHVDPLFLKGGQVLKMPKVVT